MEAYRSLALVPNIADLAVRDTGPVDACQECGSANRGGIHWNDTSRGSVQYHPVIGRFCSPTRRVRSGFLWLKRCPISGTHAHQHCRRCGSSWVTRAKVTP